MKYFFKTLFVLVFYPILACKQPAPPAPTERLEYFETGVLSRRTPLKDGKKEGMMTDFYPDGKRMAERFFHDDLQSGRTLIFHKNGRLKEVQYFDAGLRTKGDTLWYENGQIEFATTFEKGKKQGLLQKWNENGALIFEARYVADSVVEIKGKAVR